MSLHLGWLSPHVIPSLMIVTTPDDMSPSSYGDCHYTGRDDYPAGVCADITLSTNAYFYLSKWLVKSCGGGVDVHQFALLVCPK